MRSWPTLPAQPSQEPCPSHVRRPEAVSCGLSKTCSMRHRLQHAREQLTGRRGGREAVRSSEVPRLHCSARGRRENQNPIGLCCVVRSPVVRLTCRIQTPQAQETAAAPAPPRVCLGAEGYAPRLRTERHTGRIYPSRSALLVTATSSPFYRPLLNYRPHDEWRDISPFLYRTYR